MQRSFLKGIMKLLSESVVWAQLKWFRGESNSLCALRATWDHISEGDAMCGCQCSAGTELLLHAVPPWAFPLCHFHGGGCASGWALSVAESWQWGGSGAAVGVTERDVNSGYIHPEQQRCLNRASPWFVLIALIEMCPQRDAAPKLSPFLWGWIHCRAGHPSSCRHVGKGKANKHRGAKIRVMADGAPMGRTAKQPEWNVSKHGS